MLLTGSESLPTQEIVLVPNTPVTKTWVGRIAWSLLRHPMKSHSFPAKNERLITPEELLRFSH